MQPRSGEICQPRVSTRGLEWQHECRQAAEWRQVVARCFRLPSLRDLGGAGGVKKPWVETQGYWLSSLRDWFCRIRSCLI
ncbi:MAG TPA: hypothetical protein DDX19_08280 [Rhodopirellula baltica]|uniref:Uncharacterized protein n=1 Tax=Rhodopirellula baltica (strain DSM 10527 / NCIMB 13988 / SH1) TaxID=243090 RepID=Q7UJ51_RHOBA|nr:hypothetical protein RB12131 [Rhodopirellula baltica SH 1]HBE62721.1 hypothetical protein [Rhodopirellula baltica]